MNYNRFSDKAAVLDGMVQIDFREGSDEGFRKVKETLQRMGVPSRKDQTLFQTAHILHKQGKYYICHFKELFALDGREAEITESDVSRRNLIVKYLVDWNLIAPVAESWTAPMGTPRMLKVLKYFERDDWDLQAKYNIGQQKEVA